VAKARALMEWGGIAPTSVDTAIRTVFETDRVGDITELLKAWL
jgi:hypothetical protein